MKRFDFLLIFVLLGSSLASGVMAWKLYKGQGENSSMVVGQLTSMSKDVFKKSETDFFYIGVTTGSSVHENDQITTGLESEVEIQLRESKSTIRLKEMSHIILKMKNNVFALDIKSGEIQTMLLPGEVVLVDGVKRLQAYGEAAQINYKKGVDGSSFTVLTGKVLLQEGDRESVVDSSPVIKNAASPIQILHPEMDALVINPEGQVRFRWQEEENRGPYHLKLFMGGKLVQNYVIPQMEALVKLPREGRYSWLVERKNAGVVTSTSVHSFSLNKGAFLTLDSPEPGKKLSLASGERETTLSFKWRQRQSSEVSLQIEERLASGEFRQLLTEKIAGTGNNEVARKVPLGNLRWRIESSQMTSQWFYFEIVAEELPLLAAPHISDIKTNYTERIKKEGVAVSWPPVEQAQYYEVEFAGNILSTKTPAIKLPAKETGRFKYKARTINAINKSGAWSEARTITVNVPPQPTPVAKASLPPPPPPPAPSPSPPPEAAKDIVKYTSGNGIEIPKVIAPAASTAIVSRGEITGVDILIQSLSCGDYEIEIDTSSRFLNPTILKREDGKGSVELKKGSYHIRARCWRDGDMGDWSLVRQFLIQ